jgi:cytidylate kinase
MAVITLSRQLGSRGDELASRVAEEMGLYLIDATMINRAALKAGVPEVALAELDLNRQRGLVEQVLGALRTMPTLRRAPGPTTKPASSEHRPDSGVGFPFPGLFSPTVPPISASLESYERMVGMVIRGLARQGGVVIVGRGGQALLRKYPCALHVLAVAPQSLRVDTVQARLGGTKREAQSRVRASDRARADYLRRYHGIDGMDPANYHLTINTGRLSLDAAVTLISAAERALSSRAGEETTSGDAVARDLQHSSEDA